MSGIVEIAYFNTFILSGAETGTTNIGQWHIEESRIKGDYNGASVDYGVKAYAVDEKYGSRRRKNAMRYSGIYNIRTGVNDTNKFPSGQEITKSVDSAYGAINKLFAEETDLTIFQEDKVHAAMIDKDAIFTAEGGQISAAANIVIGQIRPYQGTFGIGNYPESFAYYNGRKYFVDKERASILRLSRDGITKISDYGMDDYFSDTLKVADVVRGMFDEDRGEYIVTLQTSADNLESISQGLITDPTDNTTTNAGDYATIGFYEDANGWTSFYTYKPGFGFSHANDFYTWEKGEEELYVHGNQTVKRSSFYGNDPDPAYVRLFVNQDPSTVKNFLTINYEGTTGWEASEIKSENYTNLTYNSRIEEAYKIAQEGIIVYDGDNIAVPVGFIRKESEYSAPIKNKHVDYYQDNSYFNSTGLKGHYLDLTMQYWNVNENTAEQIGDPAEIFSVSSEAVLSSK